MLDYITLHCLIRSYSMCVLLFISVICCLIAVGYLSFQLGAMEARIGMIMKRQLRMIQLFKPEDEQRQP